MWYNANQYNTKVIMVMIRGNVMNKGYDLSAYDRNQHSVYLLYYHLILVVKYRRKVFDDTVSERGKGNILLHLSPIWNHTGRMEP